MAKQKQRRAAPVSLAPLTTEQAPVGLLRVKPADVRKMERAGKKKRRTRRG